MKLFSDRRCEVHKTRLAIRKRLNAYGNPQLYTICLHCDNERSKRNYADRKINMLTALSVKE